MENIKSKSVSRELKSLEVEGKTPEDAILKALTILKAKRNEVRVRILSEEQRGLFGMEGSKPAKVKVTLLKTKKLDKEEKTKDNRKCEQDYV